MAFDPRRLAGKETKSERFARRERRTQAGAAEAKRAELLDEDEIIDEEERKRRLAEFGNLKTGPLGILGNAPTQSRKLLGN